jgi:hypothetical protein
MTEVLTPDIYIELRGRALLMGITQFLRGLFIKLK